MTQLNLGIESDYRLELNDNDNQKLFILLNSSTKKKLLNKCETQSDLDFHLGRIIKFNTSCGENLKTKSDWITFTRKYIDLV